METKERLKLEARLSRLYHLILNRDLEGAEKELEECDRYFEETRPKSKGLCKRISPSRQRLHRCYEGAIAFYNYRKEGIE
ncbi:MAG TPA: hypothetical protein VFE88_03630 [Candidatus Nanoarchaeia archaeon]|nr:hypothetical protein [Candidatus Nanoarchaeia archaeon]